MIPVHHALERRLERTVAVQCWSNLNAPRWSPWPVERRRYGRRRAGGPAVRPVRRAVGGPPRRRRARRGGRLRRRVALRSPRWLCAPCFARPRVLDRPQRARGGGAAARDRVARAQRRQPGRRHARRDGGDAPGGQRRPAAARNRSRRRRQGRPTQQSSWRSGDRFLATPRGGRRSSRRSPRCVRCGRAPSGVPAGSCDHRRPRR